MNRLYFGDNFKWLSDRKEFPDASVDLVYLDPPFNSNADYNVLFREPSGQVSQAQFHAFTDTWSWADAAETYHQFHRQLPERRGGRADGSAPQLPETFTNDGLSRDDGAAPPRNCSHK
jgi:adenine specific DNA methylase Mod